MNNLTKYIVIILAGVLWGVIGTLWVQNLKREASKIEGEVATIKWRQNHYLLSNENLYNELVAQGVDFPEIVQAQATLETGHFKSFSCLQRNNLFGLRNGDGTYMSFPHWTLAVDAYKKHIQKYKVPPSDYYIYLEELGYAEDSSYTTKLKEIVNKK